MTNPALPRRTRSAWKLPLGVLVGGAVLFTAVVALLGAFGVLSSSPETKEVESDVSEDLRDPLLDDLSLEMTPVFGHFEFPLGDYDEMERTILRITPGALSKESPVRALEIPTIGVDAPVGAKGVDLERTMASPDGPNDIVWYDFTGEPGSGSNAVFGGHVDVAGYGPAVSGG